MATRMRLAPAARRAQLLALGVELFSERPYDAFSLDELATRAGVSKGLIYHYFPTKKEFYVAALREATAEMLELVDLAAGGDPESALRAGLGGILGFVEQHANAYRAVLRGGIGADPDVQAVADSFRRSVHARVVEAAELREAPPVVQLAVRSWIGMVEAASLEWLDHHAVGREELVEFLARAFFATLQAAAANP